MINPQDSLARNSVMAKQLQSRRGSDNLSIQDGMHHFQINTARSGRSNEKGGTQVLQNLTSRWSSQSSQSKQQFESFSQIHNSIQKRDHLLSNEFGLESLRQEGNFV